MPEIVATIMLAAASSTSPFLSLFFSWQPKWLQYTQILCGNLTWLAPPPPSTASSAVSLSSKRHKLIMSRKKRHSLRQLSPSLLHTPFVSLSPAFQLKRRCLAFALLARGSYNCLVCSGSVWFVLLCWCVRDALTESSVKAASLVKVAR